MMASSSLFRSEKMSLLQFYIPFEVAQATIHELGEAGLVHFRDLNPNVNAFQRPFVAELRRLDDMERKLRYVATQAKKNNISIRKLSNSGFPAFQRTVKEIDELQLTLTDLESRLQQMNQSKESLLKRQVELIESKHVLRETANFFSEVEGRQEDRMFGKAREEGEFLNDIEASETAGLTAARNINLGFVCGVIVRKKIVTFERVLWRSLRGNLYMNHSQMPEVIDDPATGTPIEKNVFIVFAHGKETLAKIRKICESLGATIYNIDENPDKRREHGLEVMARIEDINSVLYNTNQTIISVISSVAQSVESWTLLIRREKAVYHTMNLFSFDSGRKCLIAEGWCPSSFISDVSYALRAASERSGTMVSSVINEMQTQLSPPTFHKVNSYTAGFQEIVDSYGIAAYQEVNPGLFTIITFPFLFAVMFGDLGHGIMLACAGFYLVYKGDKFAKSESEIVSGLVFAKWIILLMGLFSMYIGLLYNDCFSKSIPIFSTGFERVEGQEYGKFKSVYPFGIDWGWQMGENDLVFLNSYKMKQAIIFGIFQMMFGISLGIFNHLHAKDYVSIYFETIPQMIFLFSLFGYLVIIIVIKWLNPVDVSLLNTLIFMVLQFGGEIKPQNLIFSGQREVQMFLVGVAFVCVPIMWLVKPFYLKRQHAKKITEGYSSVTAQGSPSVAKHQDSPSSDGAGGSPSGAGGSGSGDGHGHGHGSGEFNFGDVFVHQSIHTIEFCLGCISNTASYLRLWALSLAHAQLSQVLYNMILAPMLGSPFALFIAFYFWFGFTAFILLVMEGLSAFLHALRLHWIEFNSKFYQGTGYKFIPFTFEKISSRTLEANEN